MFKNLWNTQYVTKFECNSIEWSTSVYIKQKQLQIKDYFVAEIKKKLMSKKP